MPQTQTKVQRSQFYGPRGTPTPFERPNSVSNTCSEEPHPNPKERGPALPMSLGTPYIHPYHLSYGDQIRKGNPSTYFTANKTPQVKWHHHPQFLGPHYVCSYRLSGMLKCVLFAVTSRLVVIHMQ